MSRIVWERTNKRDTNEQDIVDFWRAAGWDWKPCPPGFGCDGFLIGKHHIFPVEIKDDSKPPSAQKLTKKEREFAAMLQSHGVALWVIKNADDARALIEFRFGSIKG